MESLSITPSKLSPFSSCTFQHFNKTKKLSFRTSASKDNPDAASRRDLLISLGGLYGTATGLKLDSNGTALAAPIEGPDISKCGPAEFPTGATPVPCCPPVGSIVDFKLPRPSARLRVRPAAHLVDAKYVAKYKKAVSLMKSLPDDDPRNFTQQANVHCAYCDGAYDQVGFPDQELQVHNSWLFFPFHRYYLYFYERILGKLIGDDTFALPFWNWDSRQGMKIPEIYTPPTSSLYDPLRDPDHQPPTTVDFDFSLKNPISTSEDLIGDNLRIMYRQFITNGPTPELFLGAPLRGGEPPEPYAGSMESGPHATVHVWTGDSRVDNRLDMGSLFSAARDPIFFAHHSNIDRLWDVWRTLGGKRKNFTDPDWLNAAFLFYDENKQLVRVRIKDSLSAEQLGYTYQKVRNEWENAKCFRGGTGKAEKPAVEPSFPVKLEKANVAATVARPAKEGKKADDVELLVVDGIEFDGSVFTKFDVYVNASSADVLRVGVAECAGSFVHVPHLKRKVKDGDKNKNKNKSIRCIKFALPALLEDIGAAGEESVVVTLVPRVGTVTIAGLSIKYVGSLV